MMINAKFECVQTTQTRQPPVNVYLLSDIKQKFTTLSQDLFMIDINLFAHTFLKLFVCFTGDYNGSKTSCQHFVYTSTVNFHVSKNNFRHNCAENALECRFSHQKPTERRSLSRRPISTVSKNIHRVQSKFIRPALFTLRKK